MLFLHLAVDLLYIGQQQNTVGIKNPNEDSGSCRTNDSTEDRAIIPGLKIEDRLKRRR